MSVKTESPAIVLPHITESSCGRILDDDVVFRRIETDAIRAFSQGSCGDGLVGGYFELRRRVYHDELGILELPPDAQDIDSEDLRSRHFIALSGRDGGADVVGAMRLIVRNAHFPESLPVETLFAGELSVPRPERAFEVSRFISRHPDRRRRNLVWTALMRIGLSDAIRDDLGPAYAVIERPFFRLLCASGVPTTEIGREQYIERYRTNNLAAEIGTFQYARALGKDAIDSTYIRGDETVRLEDIIWQS